MRSVSSPISGARPDSVSVDMVRSRCLEFYDHCLLVGDAATLTAYLHEQVAVRPPQLNLLRDLADDFQERLIALWLHRWENRHALVAHFKMLWAVDLTTLTPLENIARFHLLDCSSLWNAVHPAIPVHDQDRACHLLDNALYHARQLHTEVNMTAEFQALVLDWLDALCAISGRDYWFEPSPQYIQ